MKNLFFLISFLCLSFSVSGQTIKKTTAKQFIAKSNKIRVEYEAELTRTITNKANGKKYDMYDVKVIVSNITFQTLKQPKTKKRLTKVVVTNCKNSSFASMAKSKCDVALNAKAKEEISRETGEFSLVGYTMIKGGKVSKTINVCVVQGEKPKLEAELDW